MGAGGLAAREAVGGFRVRSAWVHTWAQAADGGAEPDEEGRLVLGPVVWHLRDTARLCGTRELDSQHGRRLSRLVEDEPLAAMRLHV